MRSILMILGVVLHSSNIFKTNKNWAIYSSNDTVVADYIVNIIHIFRMPSFFVVSGFFCVLTLSRYGARHFIFSRMKRILIPLTVTALTLNVIQAVFLTSTKFRSYTFMTYFMDGGWVSHLWFLNNLIIYFFVAAIIAYFFSTQIKRLSKIICDTILYFPMICLFLSLPLLTIFIVGSNKIGFPLYSKFMVFDTYSLFMYFPYFILGCLLASSEQLLNKFSSYNPFINICIIIVATIILRYQF